MSEVDDVLFWKFVQRTADLKRASQTDKGMCVCVYSGITWHNDQYYTTEQYEALLTAVEPILAPSTFKLLPFSLSLHIHSPAVQMFQQVHNEYNFTFLNN